MAQSLFDVLEVRCQTVGVTAAARRSPIASTYVAPSSGSFLRRVGEARASPRSSSDRRAGNLAAVSPRLTTGVGPGTCEPTAWGQPVNGYVECQPVKGTLRAIRHSTDSPNGSTGDTTCSRLWTRPTPSSTSNHSRPPINPLPPFAAWGDHAPYSRNHAHSLFGSEVPGRTRSPDEHLNEVVGVRRDSPGSHAATPGRVN